MHNLLPSAFIGGSLSTNLLPLNLLADYCLQVSLFIGGLMSTNLFIYQRNIVYKYLYLSADHCLQISLFIGRSLSTNFFIYPSRI